jgi:hypothetical protein
MHCNGRHLEPATLFWFCPADRPTQIGELRSDFATLEKAVSFVLIDLPADMQATAWILVRDGWFGPSDIRKLGQGVLEQPEAAPLPFNDSDAVTLAELARVLRAGAAERAPSSPPGLRSYELQLADDSYTTQAHRI